LFIAQPSLSKTIKKFETDFNVILLERSSKILRLTDAGNIFYEKSKEVIRLLNYMEAEIRNLSNNITGEISIGMSQIIETIFFSNIAKEYIEKFLQVKLNITEEEGLIIEKLIDEGNLDIGLCILPTSNKELEAQLIFEDNFVPESDDFSYHPYNTVNKKGYSFYTGYNFHPKLKFGVRYEHFNHGPLGETPSKLYEDLDIYTAGLTYYPLKGSRRNKLVLFYEYFDERNTAPGFSRPNNIIALAAQLFILN